ncbi:MAG: hypothetical protein AAFQ41_03720 [Cyanobacteria bacterium J06623_7]
MILFKGLIAALVCSWAIALPAVATEGDAADSSESPASPQPEEAVKATAIRASIVNGVIEVLENTRRARIDLVWDMLPLTQTDEFKQSALEKARTRIGTTDMEADSSLPCGAQGIMTITIANEDLGSAKWLNDLSDEEKICLQATFALDEADGLNNLVNEPPSDGGSASFDPEADFKQDFENFWVTKSSFSTNVCGMTSFGKEGYASRPGCGRELIGNISVPEYYRMLREYYIVSDLLQTNGIAYSLDLDKAEVSLPGDTTLIPYRDSNAYIFYEGIDWEIDIVRRPISDDFNANYYRFGARAITRNPIEFQLQNVDNPQAKIALSFRESNITLNVAGLYPAEPPGGTTIEAKSVLSTEAAAQLEAAKQDTALNELDISFASITGVTPRQIVSQSLLGAADNSNVIAGGLVGNDEIQSLVGANLEVGEIAENVVPGLLFGLSPRTDDATLFLGPSIRLSVFTLAAGARFFEFDDGVRIRPAGVVSLDLAQVFDRDRSQEIKIADPNLGSGGWFDLTTIVAQDLSANIALLGYTLQQATGIDLATGSVKLLRNNKKCDLEKEPNTPNCQATEQPDIGQNIELGLAFNNLEQTNFLPKGLYYLKPPNGYAVKDCDSQQEVTKISSLDTAGNPFIQRSWIVVKKERVSAPIVCN